MSTTLQTGYELPEAFKAQVIEWRRHLHRNPELSFQEFKTAEFVEETLRGFGGLEISRPTPTSVLARLIGPRPGKVLAIRADMDALPIQEENELEFASAVPGVMHACGHDGHTAMVLGVAKLLTSRREQLSGEIRFIFQHAEEMPPGGAQEMVDAGVMEGVDFVVGSHLSSKLALGRIGIAYGAMMASPDNFTITIRGKGGHAAAPHLTVDPIIIGAQAVINLQHIVSRNIDPMEQLVVSVTQFIGGSANNVIPGTVKLGGTVRSFDPHIRSAAPKHFHRILRGITEAHGAEYVLEYEYGYSPVLNEQEITRVVEQAAVDLFGREAVVHIPPSMGGEDFSAYQQVTPGVFFNIGAENKDKGIVYPHHHPRFTVDEDALAMGVQVFLRTADKLLDWSE
ncbi:M20 family metallopeptidase [Paenibacillus sp. FSL H7-0331]|uniref:M20 family metallopeptidase n=1 Tax=Paenibacillus sp. FSL H7-0331 TaxID=1920421 RepID=UPI00096D7068|nr:M20 family metallopeptidase [Paenibacillus sp. FSL H7-0331]OMF12786.1 N-acyl-L-amino acid amidohydrolase [Paenibacillus sp. FSL H7-0331]